MKNLITLIFSATLLLSSCTDKAKPTTLNGQVRTYGSQEAIKHPPVKVQILHQEFGSTGLGGSYNYTPIAETWTDQEGYFTLSGGLYEDEEYYLGVDPETVKESYHYPSPSYGMIDFPDHLITERGGTFTKNHSLVAYGWVRFHFVNENALKIQRFAYNFGGGAYEEFFGVYDEYRIWDFGGNVEHELAFGKTSDGVDSLWIDRLYVPALDTIDMKIEL